MFYFFQNYIQQLSLFDSFGYMHTSSSIHRYDMQQTFRHGDHKTLSFMQNKHLLGKFGSLDPLHQLIIRQKMAQQNYTFFNQLVQGRLENCSSIILLLCFIINTCLLTTPEQKSTIGYFAIGQVCFFYFLIIIIKLFILQHYEKKLLETSSQSFFLYEHVYADIKKLKDLTIPQLQSIHYICSQRIQEFLICFPRTTPLVVKKQVQQILKFKSSMLLELDPNVQLQKIKQKQIQAKKWYTFWTVFMINKCFSFTGLLLLLFIVVPHTCATPHGPGGLASAWLSVTINTLSLIVFICIKILFANKIQKNLDRFSSVPFVNYSYIYMKIKYLRQLTLIQLEQLKKSLVERQEQYRKYFPNDYYKGRQIFNEINNQIIHYFPKRESQIQDKYYHYLLAQQLNAKQTYTNWLGFINSKIVSFIINILKFMIVLDGTLSFNNKGSLNSTGIVGIISFVFGYIFFGIARYKLLPYLQNRVRYFGTFGFQTYRPVYYEGKKLQNLQKFQLEDIKRIILQRKQDFVNCFPKTNIEIITKKIQQLLTTTTKSTILQKMKIQKKLREDLNFWNTYADSFAYTTIYSALVLQVLLIITVSDKSEEGKDAVGYLGIFTIVFLISSIIFLKLWWIPHIAQQLKQSLTQGFSEYNLVYTGSKILRDVQYSQLQKISKIISQNPDDFKRCFPKCKIEIVDKDIKDMMALKLIKKQHLPKNQKMKTLIKQRDSLKKKYGILKTINTQIWYVLIPIWIVFFILIVDTLANTVEQKVICCWVVIAGVCAVLIQLLYYNIWLKPFYQDKINVLDDRIIMEKTKEK